MSWHDNDELPKMKTEHAQSHATQTHFVAKCGIVREIGKPGPEITTFMASVNCRECLNPTPMPDKTPQDEMQQFKLTVNGWIQYLYACDNQDPTDKQAVIDQYTNSFMGLITRGRQSILKKVIDTANGFPEEVEANAYEALEALSNSTSLEGDKADDAAPTQPQDCPTPSGDAYCLRCLHTHDMDAECVGDTQPPDKHQTELEHILSMVWNDGAMLAGGAYLNAPHYGLVEAIPAIEALIARTNDEAYKNGLSNGNVMLDSAKRRITMLEEQLARTNRESRIDELNWVLKVKPDILVESFITDRIAALESQQEASG